MKVFSMKILSKALLVLIIPSISFFASGCEMLPHALQPNQWSKLNRGPAPREDTYFSVPDYIPELEQKKSSQNVD
ncbi:hypothetical protein [uncultured Gimesia sp.]|uniref:hypothetical protein n=1 Tax=uncultured Gimesia sp. TaxID=1678688 RepID=UPI0026213DB9|nr:hypothetical protein [uncultured Gimesia sp.]